MATLLEDPLVFYGLDLVPHVGNDVDLSVEFRGIAAPGEKAGNVEVIKSLPFLGIKLLPSTTEAHVRCRPDLGGKSGAEERAIGMADDGRAR